MMKCVICDKGETMHDFTTVTLERGDAKLVFKPVPALICDNCGEVYLEDEIGSHLLAEIQEDEARWDAQFAATDDAKLAELVAAVEAEIDAGKTTPLQLEDEE